MPDGTEYDATDPGLGFFVLATLVDSDLLVDQKYLRCLTDAQRAQYYDEEPPARRRVRIPRGRSRDLPEFRDYIAAELPTVGGVRRRTTGSATSMLMPRYIKIPRPVVFGYRAVMADLLPAHVREGFGLNTRLLTVGGPPDPLRCTPQPAVRPRRAPHQTDFRGTEPLTSLSRLL